MEKLYDIQVFFIDQETEEQIHSAKTYRRLTLKKCENMFSALNSLDVTGFCEIKFYGTFFAINVKQ